MELKTEDKRNYGIDLLRLLAMYMVIVLHILGIGGILESCEKFSLNYYVAWLLETMAYCAVDVFAMISGYVMVKANFNVFNIIPLWFTVYFYSSIITFLFKFIPSFTALHQVTNLELIKGLIIPICSRQYWYFTAYFGIFFFIPFVNKLLNSLKRNEFLILCLIIITVYTIFPVFGLKIYDTFFFGGGCTSIWLLCCYIIGAFFKIYPLNFTKKKCIMLYFIAIFFAWFSRFISHIILKYFFLLDKELNLFIDYTSIFIIVSGIALLLFFSQLKINKYFLKKIITYATSLSFSIYLIHVHPIVFNFVLNNRFSNFAFLNPFFLILKVIFIAFVIFIICMIIDSFRYCIFYFLKINCIPKLLYKKHSKIRMFLQGLN